MKNLLCSLFGHSWDGCICTRCGEKRDVLHKWDLCKGICIRCGRRCTPQHDFDGCICKKCGTALHNYDGCVCRKCGAIREMRFPSSYIYEYDRNGNQKMRSPTYKDTGHKGPWEQSPDHPCIVVCKACGKKAWNHQMTIHKSGIVGPSSGGGSLLAFPDSNCCSVCGYSAQAGRNTQREYVDE